MALLIVDYGAHEAFTIIQNIPTGARKRAS
jgi:hypothetical protein